MRKLSERQRLVATILVTVALAGGLVALIFMDRRQIAECDDEIASLDDRIRAADNEISRTKDREDKVLVFRAVENRELAVLPTRQMIAGFHSNLSLFLSSAGVRFVELPESTAVESELAKGIYVTRSTITCSGDASSILKLINMLENDPRLVAVKGMKITAGEKDRLKPDENVLHEVDLTLETYFYNPEAAATQPLLPIPGAERRLEEATVKDAITSFQPERPDTYVLRPASSRRDAFVDPRRAKIQEDPQAVLKAMQEQEPIVLELERALLDVSEKEEQRKEMDVGGDIFRRDRLAQEIDQDANDLAARIAQIEQMKTVTQKVLQERVAVVRTRLESFRGTRSPRELILTKAVATHALDAMAKAFDSGDYDAVANLTTQWTQFLRGKQVDADATPIVDQINTYRRKAKTISEFHRRVVRVTGTIVNTRDERKSVALINGHTFHKGDKFDDKGEIVIAAIVQDAVDFLYEGEVIRVQRSSGDEEDNKKPAQPRGPAAKHG